MAWTNVLEKQKSLTINPKLWKYHLKQHSKLLNFIFFDHFTWNNDKLCWRVNCFFARTWFFLKMYILELNWKIVPCFLGGQVYASLFSLDFFIWYCFCLSCKGFCCFSTPDNECCFSSLTCSTRAVGLEGLNLLRINYASEFRNLFTYNYTFTDIISTKGTTLEISENI